jgi:hypothetical protein
MLLLVTIIYGFVDSRLVLSCQGLRPVGVLLEFDFVLLIQSLNEAAIPLPLKKGIHSKEGTVLVLELHPTNIITTAVGRVDRLLVSCIGNNKAAATLIVASTTTN